MITSVVDICNMALDYCNVRTITSLEEDTKQAKTCSRWYDLVRKSLLLNINASFSIKRAFLVEDVNNKPVYGYSSSWVLPSDCLQVLNLDSPIDDRFYQIEGGFLYCDKGLFNQVKIRYIADIEDVSKFDCEFCDCLALKLAEKICLPLVEDEQKTSLLKQLAQQKYVEASTKYGRDNKVVVINRPQFRRAKLNSEINDCNYPIR